VPLCAPILRRCGLILAGGLLAVPLAGEPVGPSAVDLFRKGAQLHEAGDLIGAIAAYEQALDKDASLAHALSNLGAAYSRLGRYDEAVKQYQKALDGRPEDSVARFNMALAYYKGARIGAAAEQFEKVVATAPENGNALLLLADCRRQQGRDQEVIELLEPRAVLFEDNPLFVYLMGNALVQRSDLQRGQAYIDRLFAGGEPAIGHLVMGAAFMDTRDYLSAALEFEKAIALNPQLATAHSLYGKTLLETGRRDEATQAFRSELKLNPNDFESNLQLGFLAKEDDNTREALGYLDRAKRLRPGHPGLLHMLGSLYLAEGRLDEARTALESVVQQAPEFKQGHVLLATLYYRLGDRELGNKHREIARELVDEEQALEPGASAELGPAYEGERRRDAAGDEESGKRSGAEE